MKKYLLFFLPILAFSFSLSVNSGAEDGKTYSVLNLLDEKDPSLRPKAILLRHPGRRTAKSER